MLNNNGWRKDIDGLRALAVIAVMAFHIQFSHNQMGGGWLGVDIFFVISGFLITPLLLKAQNFWDFVDFWGRRARRIFPSLILTIILVLALGYVYLMSGEFSQLGSEATFGAIFTANFYYLTKVGAYFESQRGSNFFLNLWSLGVEEQYYIFFPFIIWALRQQKWKVILAITVFFGYNFLGYSILYSKSQSFGGILSALYKILGNIGRLSHSDSAIKSGVSFAKIFVCYKRFTGQIYKRLRASGCDRNIICVLVNYYRGCTR